MGDYIMRINGQTVKNASINGSDIKEIRNATTQVVLWQKAAKDYFYFEDRSGAANSISMGSVYAGTTDEWLALEYSTDKDTWTSWDFTQSIPLAANGKVYLRGNNQKFSVSSGNYHYFGSTGNVYAGGSVRSLYDKQVPSTITSNVTMFGWMFYNMTTLVGVDTNLFAGINYGSAGSWRDTTNVFYRTFSGCSSLVTPPDLSGIGYVKGSTFRETFNQCTSLTSAAPTNIIDIDTSATNHFRSMYWQCYALTDASPMHIGFTTTGQYTLYQTFMACNNLVTPPDLTSIATLGNQSLYRAFYGCTSLTSLRVGFTQWGSETSTDPNYRSTYQWTYNVNTNGTFHCPVTLPQTKNSSDNTTSSDFIPYNWVADTTMASPTLTHGAGGSGTGSSTICNGRKFYQWQFYIKTPGVEGVTYYLNWENTDTLDVYPVDPTTSTYDGTVTYDPQSDYSEADSECVYLLHICEADMLGCAANFSVVGVKNGFVSEPSYLSICNSICGECEEPEPDCTDCTNWQACGYENYEDCRCQQYGTDCPPEPTVDCSDWENMGYESYEDCDCSENGNCGDEPDCDDCSNWEECNYSSYEDCDCQVNGNCEEEPEE